MKTQRVCFAVIQKLSILKSSMFGLDIWICYVYVQTPNKNRLETHVIFFTEHEALKFDAGDVFVR